MKTQEIIDLTSTEDREAIVLDSDGEQDGPSTKQARHTPPGGRNASTKREEREEVALDGTDEVTRKKKRRFRGKKRNGKKTVVGEEEGELIEVDATEDSGQASRAESSERASVEEGKKLQSAKAADRNLHALLDRLADADADIPHRSEPNKERRDIDSAEGVKASHKESKRRKQKRKRGKAQMETPTNGEDSMDTLFFVDEKPTEVPETAKFGVPANKIPEDGKPALWLPWNVSVFEGTGDMPVQTIVPPDIDSEDEDFIDYLAFEDDNKVRGGVGRYFHDPEGTLETKKTRIACKKCGEEGDHVARDCPVLICLTCGARNDHGTRSCPISKTCFTCGMRGHINKNCPNRHKSRGRDGYYAADCDRCGSMLHPTEGCSTLWRMYEYVDDSERLQILEDREKLRELDIGEGGEGYIAPDEWCYRCGGSGHFGDDCSRHDPLDYREPSAFGNYNLNSGPFADAEQPDRYKPRRTYADQAEKAWGDGFGASIPLDVGKNAKRKDKARMERRAQQANEDDGDDWFANPRRDPRGGKPNGGTPKAPRNGRLNTKITFGDLGQDDDRYGGRDRRDRRDSGRHDERARYDDLPGPSRETDSFQIRGAARKQECERDEWDGSIRGAASRRQSGYDGGGRDGGYEHGRKGRYRNDDRSGDRDRRRDRDGRGASPRREPRYRGGYSR